MQAISSCRSPRRPAARARPSRATSAAAGISDGSTNCADSPCMLTCGPGAGRPAACQCTSRSRGLVRYPPVIPAVTMADRHRCSRAPSPAVGAALTARCMSATLMSWQVIAAMTGATNRSHSRRWVSACLADHGRPAGCRAGERYQAIRSAPGRSRFGASAISRSVTFSSLAASRSSVAASHCRRTPFSIHTARHRPPSSRAGYTVTPHSSSTTTRPAVWPGMAGAVTMFPCGCGRRVPSRLCGAAALPDGMRAASSPAGYCRLVQTALSVSCEG